MDHYLSVPRQLRFDFDQYGYTEIYRSLTTDVLMNPQLIFFKRVNVFSQIRKGARKIGWAAGTNVPALTRHALVNFQRIVVKVRISLLAHPDCCGVVKLPFEQVI